MPLGLFIYSKGGVHRPTAALKAWGSVPRSKRVVGWSIAGRGNSMFVRTLAVTIGVTAALTGPALAQTGEASRSIRYRHTDGAIAYLRARTKAETMGVTVGRNIVAQGVRFKWVSEKGAHKHWGVRRASWVEVRKQIMKLRAESVVVPTPAPTNPPVVAQATTARVASAAPASSAPSSGLASCIVQRESGGNPQAVNGQYTGIGQWDQATWDAQGGGQYASTPLGASRAQQMAVLNHALANGQSGAWTPYDDC